MKRLLLLPVALFWITISAQEKLIQYNDFYLKNIKIEELPTNSKLSDFGPCLVDGQLFFTSFDDNATIDSEKNESKFYYQLYSVNINGIGKVTSLRHPIEGLNSDYHVGPNSYDKKTGELMVTRNNEDDPSVSKFKPIQKKSLNLEMFIAKKDGSDWKFEKEFNQNNKEYSVGHPAFTPSGDTVVFVSDMPGGLGETDLYMSVRLSDGWSVPRNLGPRLNSPGKEFTPFISNKGILIFASNGLEDNSDFDLYYTLLNDEGNPTIVKFPEPVNSESDDFGMVIEPGHIFGYFTSNRPGTGSDDIYRIDFNLEIAKIRGKVINKITRQPLNQATIEFSPPVVGSEVIYTNPDGVFEAQIGDNPVKEVTASKQGYKSESVLVKNDEEVVLELMPEIWLELSVRDAETKGFIQNLNLDINGEENISSGSDGILKKALAGGKEYYIRGTHPEYLDNSITIGAEGEPGILKATLWMYKGVAGKSFTLENIYYDFDKWDILPQSATELDKLVTILRENNGLKVELGSHTDSRGSDEYNLWLSGQRSLSAVAYIISRGIPSANIIAEKYGESQPYILSPKNESEFRQNRRTAFKILEMGSSVPKIVSSPVDQGSYGKYVGNPVTQPSMSKTAMPAYNMPAVNVAGKNFRVQFYASKKPININTSMKEIVEKFSQYGLINCEEDFLIKYQIGPFNNQDDAASVYTKIRNLGYQVMMLEYESNTKIKMLLPN